MKERIPDFIKDATNVYRTKGYIVGRFRESGVQSLHRKEC